MSRRPNILYCLWRTTLVASTTFVLSCDSISLFSSLPPTPATTRSQPISIGPVLVGIHYPLVSIGNWNAGDSVEVKVQSCERVNIFLVRSDGAVLDGAVVDPPYGDQYCQNSVGSTCFTIPKAGSYYLYLFSERPDATFSVPVSLAYSKTAACNSRESTSRPRVRILFDYQDAINLTQAGGLTQVTLSNPPAGDPRRGVRDKLKRFDLAPLAPITCSVGHFTSAECEAKNQEFLARMEAEVKQLIVERIRDLVCPLGIEVYGPEDECPDCSTVFITSNVGDDIPPNSIDSACTDLSCKDQILYGETGLDLGNRIHNDAAIVYFGSIVGRSFISSISDLINVIGGVAAHEIGHLVGLTHAQSKTNIMDTQFSFMFLRDVGFCPSQVAFSNGQVPYLVQKPFEYDPLSDYGPVPGCTPAIPLENCPD